MYVLRLGQMDVKGLVKTIGEDGLLTLVCTSYLFAMYLCIKSASFVICITNSIFVHSTLKHY
jgi:hypothetical protein